MENGLSLAAAGEIFLLDGRQRPAYELPKEALLPWNVG
jgi:hypothetical protein